MSGPIKFDGLEVYPAFDLMSYGLTKVFKKELRVTGDFENYYGISETEDAYKEIELQRPLFYCIKIKGSFIGYIGFHGDESTLKPEIYIFKQYRNKGYGTSVLNRFIDMAFKDGWLKTWREENEEDAPSRYIEKEEMIFPSKFVSTVRVENTYSCRMMTACGFNENKNVVAEFAYEKFVDGSADKC